MAQNWIPPLIEDVTDEELQKYELNNTNGLIRKTNFLYNNKPVWIAFVSRGDLSSNNMIEESGTLLSNIDKFLGIASGVIQRKIDGTIQIHNINAVNNVAVSDGKLTNAEQHLSIIYQEGPLVKYWFNPHGAFTQFMKRPFRALLLVTKNTSDGE